MQMPLPAIRRKSVAAGNRAAPFGCDRAVARLLLLVGLLCFSVQSGYSQIKVSPTGVNVSTQTPISALLTFANLNNQIPAEATWCGELIPAAPDIGNKCNPATIFGVIPARYDRTTATATRAYNDVMTLPASVARRAYQAAAGGAASSFFFVRRFVSTVGGPDEFVAVICRMAGGTAGSPFSLTNVNLGFAGTDKPVLFTKGGKKIPPLQAVIAYTGTGRLKGRWEVVLPGEQPPSVNDLLTEATLPVEKRGTQRHYSEVSRFNVLLPPGGKYSLAGPDPDQLPMTVAGEYLLLLRIEASNDPLSGTDLTVIGAGPGILDSGAVAGFPMPVLHYFVGAGSGPTTAQISLVTPVDNLSVPASEKIDFSWLSTGNAALFRLDVTDDAGNSILSALLPASSYTYRAPSWLKERASNRTLRWRVVAVDETGNSVTDTPWRTLRFEN
jgi:hypothetical protein